MKKNNDIQIAVIGGSGLYKLEGMTDFTEVVLSTPFGKPSDRIIVGKLKGTQVKVAFLPRHGRGHRILPGEVNSRANIYALKSLGVKKIISISACGSLKEEIKPRDFIFPDQIFDKTKSRQNTFFGEGIVSHIQFSEPFCRSLREMFFRAADLCGIKYHRDGVYVCIEGPQFSTKAESEVHRKLGFSVVGMTAIPEAKLAREAEICYATVGLVTDYDVWKEGNEVSIGEVVENLNHNIENVKKLLEKVIPFIAGIKDCSCQHSLENAIFTDRKYINLKKYKKLKLLIAKYIKL